MTKKLRLILFWIAFVLFIFLSAILVLYANGYRYDFQRNLFLKTGSIFLKITPPGALVTIDQKTNYQASSLPFFNSATVLAPNLLPRAHDVEITKSGYQSLHLSLEVTPQEVVALNHIVLVKQPLDPQPFNSDKILNYLSDPQNSNLAYISASSTGPMLAILDLKNNTSSHLPLNVASGAKIIPSSAFPLAWSKDASSLLIKASGSGRTYWMLYQAATSTLKNISPSLRNFSPDTINNPLLDNSGSALFFQVNQKVYRLDLSVASSTPKVVADKIQNFSVGNNATYFITTSRQLLRGDASGANPQIVPADLSVIFQPEVVLDFSGNLLGINDARTGFYLWNTDTNTLQHIAPQTADITQTPDGLFTALVSGQDLYLYVHSDLDEQPFWKKGDVKILKNVLESPHEKIAWFYDDYHLLIQDGSSLKLFSIDERGGRQLYNLNAALQTQDIFVPQKTSGTAYFLINHTLFQQSIF